MRVQQMFIYFLFFEEPYRFEILFSILSVLMYVSSLHFILASFLPSGFGERLLTEVKKLAPKDVKIKVSPVSFNRSDM